MGTWGVHSFENDDAVEWAAAYREMGLPVAKSTIEIALSDLAENKLSADLACRAIAAVEAVAFVLGRGSPDGEEKFAGGPEADRAAAEALIPECNTVIKAVSGGSELKVLWGEAAAGDYDNWIASLSALRTRVNGAQSAQAPEPAARPVENAVDLPADAPLEDIRAAIAELAAEVQALRQETSQNFLRLAKRIEGRDQ